MPPIPHPLRVEVTAEDLAAGAATPTGHPLARAIARALGAVTAMIAPLSGFWAAALADGTATIHPLPNDAWAWGCEWSTGNPAAREAAFDLPTDRPVSLQVAETTSRAVVEAFRHLEPEDGEGRGWN